MSETATSATTDKQPAGNAKGEGSVGSNANETGVGLAQLNGGSMNGQLVNVDMWNASGEFIGTAQIICDLRQAWPVTEDAICDCYQ